MGESAKVEEKEPSLGADKSWAMFLGGDYRFISYSIQDQIGLEAGLLPKDQILRFIWLRDSWTNSTVCADFPVG